MTLTARLAAYFAERPEQWIDGRELMRVAGSYAWRTRASQLRKPPYGMVIENRVRTVTQADGEWWRRSEYRYVPVNGSRSPDGDGQVMKAKPTGEPSREVEHGMTSAGHLETRRDKDAIDAASANTPPPFAPNVNPVAGSEPADCLPLFRDVPATAERISA